MRHLVTALVAGLALSGCVSKVGVVPVDGLRVIQTEALPEPSGADLVGPSRESLIGPLDTINVSVFGVENLSVDNQVDSTGQFSMPLVGTFDVRGLTPREVASFITDRLERYIKDPQVTVNVSNRASQVVVVDGSVEVPGIYPVTNQMTLMRAIAAAEGLSEFGDTDDVVLLRTVGGERYAGLYDLAAIRRGAYPDPPVYANDTVVVGDSPQRRLFKDIITVAPLLTAPLVIALQ
jgi:polysaccharide biosynthesis/export protein